MNTEVVAPSPGSPAGLRDANRRRVVDLVRRLGAPTQADIATGTALAPATVSNIVRELSDAGVLVAAHEVRTGRRVRAVRLAAGAGLVAGIDFGHRHVRVAVAGLAQEVLAESHRPLPGGHGRDDGLAEASRLLDAVLAEAAVPRRSLVGVGVGLPAPIDDGSGAVGASGVLPGWVGVGAAAAVADHLGLPAWVDNDATLGTLAERRWGALQGVDDAVYLKLSDGVGAGLVIDGRVYRGPDGTAGEIGHVAVEGPGEGYAAVCRCGNRGCLETLVSTSRLIALLEPFLGRPLTVAEIVARARGGHAPAQRVLADAARHVALALAPLCSVLTPRAVVVGGELAQAGPLLTEPLHAAIERAALPGAARTVTVVTARLAERAHVLGALALALDRVPGVVA